MRGYTSYQVDIIIAQYRSRSAFRCINYPLYDFSRVVPMIKIEMKKTYAHDSYAYEVRENIEFVESEQNRSIVVVALCHISDKPPSPIGFVRGAKAYLLYIIIIISRVFCTRRPIQFTAILLLFIIFGTKTCKDDHIIIIGCVIRACAIDSIIYIYIYVK